MSLINCLKKIREAVCDEFLYQLWNYSFSNLLLLQLHIIMSIEMSLTNVHIWTIAVETNICKVYVHYQDQIRQIIFISLA